MLDLPPVVFAARVPLKHISHPLAQIGPEVPFTYPDDNDIPVHRHRIPELVFSRAVGSGQLLDLREGAPGDINGRHQGHQQNSALFFHG